MLAKACECSYKGAEGISKGAGFPFKTAEGVFVSAEDALKGAEGATVIAGGISGVRRMFLRLRKEFLEVR